MTNVSVRRKNDPPWWVAALNSVNEAIVVIQAKGAIIFMNRVAETLTGRSLEQIRGKYVSELFYGELDDLLEQFGQQKEMLSATQVPLIIKDKNHSIVSYHLTSAKDNQSNISHHILTFRNIISPEQQVESQPEKLLQSLRDITPVLNQTFELKEFLKHILTTIRQIIEYETADIMLLESEQVMVVCTEGYSQLDLDSPLDKNFILAQGEDSHLQEMIMTQQPVVISNATYFLAWNHRQVSSYLGVPIQLNEQVVGFINLMSTTPNFFSHHQVKYVQAFADQASIAIGHAHLLESERAERKLSETLGRVGLALNSTLDLSELLDLICLESMNLFSVQAVYIWLVRGDEVIGFAGQGTNLDKFLGRRLSLAQANTLGVRVIRQKQPIFVNDAPYSDQVNQDLVEVFQIQSVLGVPLLKGDQAIGSLILLENHKAQRFAQEDTKKALVLAGYAAIAIENARLFEAETRRRFEAETLRETMVALTSAFDLKQVLEDILTHLEQVLPYDSTSLFLLEDDYSYLQVVAARGHPGSESVIGRQYSADTLIFSELRRTHQPIYLRDILSDPRFIQWENSDHIRGWMIVPLIAHGEVIGALTLDSQQVGAYSSTEARLAQSFANQAALAVEKARLFEETRKQAHQLSILNELAREMARLLDIEDLCRMVVQRVYSAFNYFNIGLVLKDPNTQQVATQIVVGGYEKIVAEREYQHPLEGGVIGKAFQTGQMVVVNNTQTHPDFFELEGMNILSELAIPLKMRGEVIGVFNVDGESPNAFGESDIAVLTIVTDQLSVALEKAYLFREVCQRAEHLEALHQVFQELIALRDLDTLLYQIADRAARLLGADGGAIYLYQPQKQRLEWLILTGEHTHPGNIFVKRDEGLAGKVWESKEPLIVNNYITWSHRLCYWQNDLPQAVVGVPIQWGDEFLGVLDIYTDNSHRPFTTEDAHLLSKFANQAAIAIHNARLYEQVQHYATELEQRVSERTFELRVLYELAQELGQVTQLGDIIRYILLRLYQAIPSDVAASLLIQDNSTGLLFLQSRWPLSATHEQQLQEIMITALDKIHPQSLENIPLDIRRIQAKDEVDSSLKELASLTQSVIFVDDKPVGILLIAAEEANKFSEEHAWLLQTIADQAAETIRRLKSLLAAEHRRLESIIAHMPDGLILLDVEHYIVLMNPEAQKLLNALTEATVGDRLTHLDEYPLEKFLVVGVPLTEIETSHRQIFEVMAKPVAVGPEAGGWILIIRDVTVERISQERVRQQEQLVAIGQLAAGIAHDFNNILTSIIGFAGLLSSDTDLSSQVQQDLQRIANQGQRAARLVRQILDFSRQSITEKRPLDLVTLVKETVKLLSRTIPELVQIHLEIEDPETEYLLNGDLAQLQQALTNLAVNARDAMLQGGELTFRLSSLNLKPKDRFPTPQLFAGEWIVLSVSDTGTGIPSDVLSHIFEPFFTTKEVGQGTGLGLAQLYGIIKQHGGDVEVNSQLGKGTTFTLYFPLLKTLASDPPTHDSAELPRGKGQIILLVEDNPGVLEVTQAMLERLAYRVLTAVNGKMALRLYEQYQDDIALVLTDITMPHMGGLALSQALQEKQAPVKIIVMTGYPLEHDRQYLYSLGIVEWLRKPLSLEQVAHTVNHILTEKE